jgi:hypothetical protein
MNSDDQGNVQTKGLTAFGVFLLWAATAASLAGTTLLCRGTVLDRVWSLNPRAYKQLAPLGHKAGIPLLIVAFALAMAGIGWIRRRYWAWWLAVLIIATQFVGDLVNLFGGHIMEGAIGVVAAGLLLTYLLRPPTRAIFRT